MTSEAVLPGVMEGGDDAGQRMLSFVNRRVGGELIEDNAPLVTG